MVPIKTKCTLCESKSTYKFYSDRHRDYYKCNGCDLIFVPPSFYLSADKEKKRYDLHQNNPYDLGYVEFLSKLLDPMINKLNPGAVGLDFGSGPTPALSLLFKKAGYPMDVYDIFFNKDETVFTKAYDFITATEVFEHLHHPLTELIKLWSMIRSGGYLGMMTSLVTNEAGFPDWRYKDDLTHVCFFSPATMGWLANQIGAEMEIVGEDVVILQKLTKYT